ncbi:MAG: winged helix-turn-helix transcriptional regulator, partial [Dehalococcoidia bacterium]
RTKFAEFQASLQGIPTNLLGDRLKQLEEHGIVTRHFYSEHPPRAEYVLTEKGRALDPVLGALTEFGNRFMDCDGAVTRGHRTCGEPLRLRWYCSHCDAPAGRNVTITHRAVPAAS